MTYVKGLQSGENFCEIGWNRRLPLHSVPLLRQSFTGKQSEVRTFVNCTAAAARQVDMKRVPKVLANNRARQPEYRRYARHW